MADQIERQVIEIDNSQAKTAQKEVGDGWVIVERRADTAAKKVGSTVDQASQDMVKTAETGRRTISSIFDRIEAKAQSMREFAGSAVKTTAELIIAWEAASMAASAFATRTKELVSGHGEHVAAMGGLVNAYRSARIALSPTIFTVLSIGAVAAIEKLGELSYKTGALAEKAEVLSIKTKIAAYDLDVLGRAAKNVGGNTETLIAATTKLIGAQDKLRALGVDTSGSLAQQFRDAVISIERIENPVQRIQATFDLFGTEVGEKMLPLLNGRLNDSIARVERLGAVLDPAGREAVLGFKNAVDQGIGSLKSMFEGVGDVATAIEVRLSSAIARGSRWIKEFSEKSAQFKGGGGGPGIAPFIPVPDIDPAQFKREAQVIIAERLRAFGLTGNGQQTGSTGAIAAMDAQPREFDKTIDGIRHRIRQAEDLREKLRRSFVDPNTNQYDKERLIAPAMMSQSRLIEDLKAQEAALRAGEEAAKKAQAATERAQDILRNAQEAEQDGVLKIALRYENLRRELGLTAEARRALAQAEALDIAREEKQIALEIRKLDREREQTTARRRTGFMVDAGRARLAEFQFTQQTREMAQQNQEAQYSLEVTRIEGLREARLRAVDAVHAYTLRDQQALNAQRASIEEQYAIELLRLRTDAIDREATYRIEKIKETLTEEQLNSQEFLERQAAIRTGAALKAKDLEIQTQSRIDEIRERAAIKQSELIIQRNERVFDSLKRQAEGVIDALITRTSTLGDAIKNIFKAAFLTPVKDALSSRIAAFLTGQVTGVPVSLQSQGSLGAGQGRFSGALGGIISTLGVGMAPVSRTTPPFLPSQSSAATAAGLLGFGFGSGGFGANSNGYHFPGGQVPLAGSRAGQWASMAQSVLGASGGQQQQRGGIMSMLPFGGFGGMRDFFGLGNSISTGAGTATTFGAATLGQKLSSLGKSDGALMAGIGLGLDGWDRGGWTGAAEMGGAGALIGFRFGGPVGAAIGAAAGFGIGAIKALFFKSPEQKIVDKVKQVYGLSIDKYFAKNTIWPIIQGEFGGNIDIGVRSEKIKNLLDVYGSQTNQPGRIQAIDNVARGVVLNQTGGRIVQDATWVNGTAYNYGGSTAGIGRSFAPNPAIGGGVNVSIQLDGQATTSVMRGETVRTVSSQPGLIASALQSANNGSMLRRDNAAGLFDPLAVTT